MPGRTFLVDRSFLFPNELRTINSRTGKSRLTILMLAATFVRLECLMKNARIRTTVSARESALMGPGTCGTCRCRPFVSS